METCKSAAHWTATYYTKSRPATALAALTGATALSAYVNGKFHIYKDLLHLYYQRRGVAHQERLKRQNKINIWGTFVHNARKLADLDCLWYSDPLTTPPTTYTFTWRQAYTYACQYAQWFLDNGVQPGECVGFYLQNSPDFMLAWMGLLSIGCYPSFINYNLVGGALGHCTKIAECRLLLVDDDIKDRVLNCEELKAMGVRIQVLDQAFRDLIHGTEPKDPDSKFTRDANEKTRLALRYTSGTTGYPKGVMATTGRYYSRVAAQFTEMGLRPLKRDGSGDRWYICMPMCHATGGSGALVCLIMPTTLLIGLVPLNLNRERLLMTQKEALLCDALLGRSEVFSRDGSYVRWRDCSLPPRHASIAA